MTPADRYVKYLYEYLGKFPPARTDVATLQELDLVRCIAFVNLRATGHSLGDTALHLAEERRQVAEELAETLNKPGNVTGQPTYQAQGGT